MTRAALVLSSLILLGGCITLLPDPPPAPRVFVLEAAQTPAQPSDPIEAVIGVAQPDGERAILGPDLVWRTGDELAYVAGVQWSNRASDALQSLLVETIAQQGRFDAAVRAGEARGGYEVRWDIYDFEVDGDAMQARFRANVRVMAAPGRRLIAQHTVSADAPVSSRSATEAAQALARAAREGSARIGEFAAEAALEHQRANAASEAEAED